jgi:hypothetical protein
MAAAAKAFHLWKVAHFQNSYVPAYEGDSPSLLFSFISCDKSGQIFRD